ncbi:unnamed protein product [Paramecium primaurelia]|uniref:Transmembrane protein n=1 Tax=Paramecium primaurelia TaxID=5886 RepID=A0A8S1NWH9_PARPR|nr:unnamed protein product [Paramecium primaurelia]
MLYSIQKGLKRIDIFGQTITLNMNKNAYYTTSFGGCSSIMIICLLSLIFYSNIADFFTKANVYYNSQTAFSNDPNYMKMNDNNAMFALSIDQNNYTKLPFFNITMEQKIYERSLNGTIKKSTIEIPLEPCTLNRFNNVVEQQGIDTNFNDSFNYLGMDQWLCPRINYQLELQGTYSSETFKFIKIIVSDCQNNTNSSYWNPVCANETLKSQYLNANGQFKLQVFQINTMVNPQKAKNHKTMYLDSDMYFSFVPNQLSRLANVYYRSYVINNDQSLLPYEDIQKEELIVRKAEDFRDLTELGRDTDSIYATIYLRRSPFTEIIDRNYEKLGDLLSYLGGFMQIFRVIFGFFIAFYNRTSMLIELSNRLYDFKEVTSRSYIRKGAFSQNLGEVTTPPDEMNIILRNQPNNDLQKVEWKQFIHKLVERSQPIKLNLKILINELSCGYFFNNTNSSFFTKAMMKINNELDLHNILHQLQEVSKLKTVLLQKPQQILFNFSPKPIITLNQENNVPSRIELDFYNRQSYIRNKEEIPNEELFTQLQDAYKTVQEEMENSQNSLICQKTINFKLTKQIDDELGKFLRSRRMSCINQEEIS